MPLDFMRRTSKRFIRTMLGGWAYNGLSDALPPNAPVALTAGCGGTTIADDTKPSADPTPNSRLNNMLGTDS